MFKKLFGNKLAICFAVVSHPLFVAQKISTECLGTTFYNECMSIHLPLDRGRPDCQDLFLEVVEVSAAAFFLH